MPTLLLVKHGSPDVDPSVPAERWPLSERGRDACGPLADALRAHAPTRVVSSTELKASETGTLLAERLGVPFFTAPDLHEHDRSNVPHLPSREFISLMEVVFRKPDELVLGRETAQEALDRFSRAIDGVLNAHANQTVAIVSHGTVIALWLEQLAGRRSGYELWRRMGLPSYAVIDLPGRTVASIVERI